MGSKQRSCESRNEGKGGSKNNIDDDGVNGGCVVEGWNVDVVDFIDSPPSPPNCSSISS